jgi:hypothetical protein
LRNASSSEENRADYCTGRDQLQGNSQDIREQGNTKARIVSVNRNTNHEISDTEQQENANTEHPRRKRNRSEEAKKENTKCKHPFIENYCDITCKKKCKELDIGTRKENCESFWKEGYALRNKFLAGYVRLERIRRQTVESDAQPLKSTKKIKLDTTTFRRKITLW